MWGAEFGKIKPFQCRGEGLQSGARWRPSLITPQLSGGQGCGREALCVLSALLFSVLGAGESEDEPVAAARPNVLHAEGSKCPWPLMWRCHQYIV